METNNFEVRANIQFLFLLEWIPSHIIEALQKVYGNAASKKEQFINGLTVFELVEKTSAR